MTHSIERARRGLGQRLRKLRGSAGLTGNQLANQLGWSQSKVSKIETGRQAPSPEDVAAWVRACGAPEAHTDLLARLRNLESMWVEWKEQLGGGLGGIQSRIVTEEERVSQFRAYESMIIPGLLQTPGYAAAVLEMVSRRNGTAIGLAETVEQRIRRQEILYRRDKRFHFLIAEAALHHRRGDRDTMIEQIDRLISVSGLSNVSVGIIPFDAPPPYLPLHGFWVQDEDAVIIETASAELTLTHRSEIEQYLHVFEMASAGARFNDGARELLHRATRVMSS
ncbi:transcriptional regulator [Nocardiopsis sp. CNR-923]|uniref:helix-turn-helix domain-containing protein n=1 Tax=Nocardiopsis sp. CNR-923 TaxID=1904965 RepID=UPI000969A7E2|nr:helix-turn-helix transcriptional regulator [Nocardiopsis sp. CNR-923]OLT27882.1 transcriptional regulator [Nocardiopsis sp. CNR-923]